jgi:hypothetical protein
MTVGQDLKGAVLAELKDVRGRGYIQIDAPRFTKKIGTRWLETAAEILPGYGDARTRAAILKLVLLCEIDRLDEPYREWLNVSFGLSEGLNPTEPASLRMEATRRAGEQDTEVFRRGKEAAALSALADQIVADCLQGYTYPPVENPQMAVTVDDGTPSSAATQGSHREGRTAGDRWRPAIVLALLALVGAVVGGVIVPRLYWPPLVWSGSAHALSMVITKRIESKSTDLGYAVM